MSLFQEMLLHLKASLPDIFGFCETPFFLLLSSWLNESRQVPQSVLSPLLKPKRTLRSVINRSLCTCFTRWVMAPAVEAKTPSLPAVILRLLLSDPEELVSLRVGDLRKHSFAPPSPLKITMGRWSGVQDLIKVCLIERNHPSLGQRFKSALPSIYMARKQIVEIGIIQIWRFGLSFLAAEAEPYFTVNGRVDIGRGFNYTTLKSFQFPIQKS